MVLMWLQFEFVHVVPLALSAEKKQRQGEHEN